MSKDAIFDRLPESALEQLAAYLRWDPPTSTNPARFLSQVTGKERLSWLGRHRSDLEEHMSWVGTPIFGWAAGARRSYREIVMDLAGHLKLEFVRSDSTAELERKLVAKVWNDAVARLTPEQRDELLDRANALAQKYGAPLTKEAGALAALSAAQMSGFGVYILGSTLLGAINSALGLGLGFGVFTGLSSLISLAIGPIGWAAVGLMTVHKIGAPNYKKLLPAVVLIAAERAATEVSRPEPESEGKAAPGRAEAAPHAAHRAPETAQQPETGQIATPTEAKGLLPAKAAPCTELATPTVRTASAAQESLLQGQALAPQDAALIEQKKEGVWNVTEEFVRQEAKKIKPRTPPLRIKPSRAEKTTWSLCPKYRPLDEFLRKEGLLREGQHFLDLPSEDQRMVQELFVIHQDELREAERSRSEKESADRAKVQRERRDASKLQRNIEKRRKRYESLMPNLQFHDEAVERLVLYDSSYESSADVFNEALGWLNINKLKVKCSIPRTKVNESEAKYGYRIYWRPNGGPRKFVLLVGDKDSQPSDIKLLQGPLNAA